MNLYQSVLVGLSLTLVADFAVSAPLGDIHVTTRSKTFEVSDCSGSGPLAHHLGTWNDLGLTWQQFLGWDIEERYLGAVRRKLSYSAAFSHIESYACIDHQTLAVECRIAHDTLSEPHVAAAFAESWRDVFQSLEWRPLVWERIWYDAAAQTRPLPIDALYGSSCQAEYGPEWRLGSEAEVSNAVAGGLLSQASFSWILKRMFHPWNEAQDVGIWTSTPLVYYFVPGASSPQPEGLRTAALGDQQTHDQQETALCTRPIANY